MPDPFAQAPTQVIEVDARFLQSPEGGRGILLGGLPEWVYQYGAYVATDL